MSRYLHRTLVGLTVAGLAFTASADVFRCMDTNGKIEYRDSPCAPGDVGKKLELAAIGPAAEIDAETRRARIARESAEFNARFDEAHRKLPMPHHYHYYEPAIERGYPAEPTYYAYAGPLCGPDMRCGPKARATHQHRKPELRRVAPTPKPLPTR